MEFSKGLVFLVMWIIACSPDSKTSEQEYKEMVDDISNIQRYQDEYVIPEMIRYFSENYLDDPCSNELLRSIHDLVLYLDDINTELINKSGGFNENGRLIYAEEKGIASDILDFLDFHSQIRSKLIQLESLNAENSYPFGNNIIEKIKEDLRVILDENSSEEINYSDQILPSLTLQVVYGDIQNVKVAVMFSEVVYFEMLKSHGCPTGNNSAAPKDSE